MIRYDHEKPSETIKPRGEEQYWNWGNDDWVKVYGPLDTPPIDMLSLFAGSGEKTRHILLCLGEGCCPIEVAMVIPLDHAKKIATAILAMPEQEVKQ